MHRSQASVAAVALFAALLAAEAVAQNNGDAPAPSAEDVADEVIVRGRRMSELRSELRIHIGKFIAEVAAPPPGRGFARWEDRVCIGIHNLQQDAAQYLVDRIARLALDVGLTPGEPGCGPDVIVVFTTNGRETATSIVENQPTLLRPSGEGGMHQGIEALDAFASADRAVRWWHLSLPVDARTGQPAVPIQGSGAPTVAVAGPSRIHSGVRDNLQYVVVIVDSSKLSGTTWEQLGDYLAIVALAQIDMTADPTEFDSILNLFTNPKAYSGLTDWDRSYIQALYAFDQERNPRLQAGQIASQMVRRELEPTD